MWGRKLLSSASSTVSSQLHPEALKENWAAAAGTSCCRAARQEQHLQTPGCNSWAQQYQHQETLVSHTRESDWYSRWEFNPASEGITSKKKAKIVYLKLPYKKRRHEEEDAGKWWKRKGGRKVIRKAYIHTYIQWCIHNRDVQWKNEDKSQFAIICMKRKFLYVSKCSYSPWLCLCLFLKGTWAAGFLCLV